MIGLGLGPLLLTAALATSEPVLCPAYPSDPPWRPITCWMLSRLAIPPDRERVPGSSSAAWEPRWEPVPVEW